MSTVIPTDVLDDLWQRMKALSRGAKAERRALFQGYLAYGSERTLARRLQARFGRQRVPRQDAGQVHPAVANAASLVAETKRQSFNLSGRWISTEDAMKLLREQGCLGDEKASVSSVNRTIQKQEILTVRRSYEIIGSPHANFKHLVDCSGSACFRSISWDGPETIVEAAPALDSTAAKNHPEVANARRQLYLFALIDSYSGYVVAEYRALPGPNSWTMASFLLETWKKTGIPEWILTDNGGENKGAVEPLLTALGVGRVKSKARAPWARGQIERTFRTIFSGFEVPLLLSLGVGTRLSLEELNRKLSEWLMKVHNAKPARMAKTGGESRLDASQQPGVPCPGTPPRPPRWR